MLIWEIFMLQSLNSFPTCFAANLSRINACSDLLSTMWVYPKTDHLDSHLCFFVLVCNFYCLRLKDVQLHTFLHS